MYVQRRVAFPPVVTFTVFSGTVTTTPLAWPVGRESGEERSAGAALGAGHFIRSSVIEQTVGYVLITQC